MLIAQKLLVVVSAAAALASAQTPSYPGELLIEPLLNNGEDERFVEAVSINVVIAGMCLNAASDSDGAIVTIEACTGATSQKWTFTGGTVQVFGTKCLDVTNGSTADGVKLQVWTCSTNSNPNQQFYYTYDNHLAWTSHSTCLDLTDGNQSAGNQIQLWSCGTSPNQVWNTDDHVSSLPTVSINNSGGDTGGELDPHGADQNGNPTCSERN
ncbi:ricin B lectin domain-containing protein [Desarmillaria tabescens]|uniref:Ricin B lectin domain-containing protein n=1 Tax=Armillaria tabescens TaxID=1929756 RepID=A0AA39NJP1_ARMTA|nr:ricin B lectin domain-containing protein [Desarmillaria tabescens]KAK0466891.1 ricin B lectin domain-containing protein [Desarmillaria tabescens]